MNTLIKNAGLPDPIYEEIGSSFVVTFKKTVGKEKTTQKTTPKQNYILTYLSKNPKASREKIAKNVRDITESGIKYSLKVLQNKGLLKRIGSAKGGYWKVLNDS